MAESMDPFDSRPNVRGNFEITLRSLGMTEGLVQAGRLHHKKNRINCGAGVSPAHCASMPEPRSGDPAPPTGLRRGKQAKQPRRGDTFLAWGVSPRYTTTTKKKAPACHGEAFRRSRKGRQMRCP